MPSERQEQFKINVLKFIRDHRLVHNHQLNNAFRPGKNFRHMDEYLKKLADAGLVKHYKFTELEPSNYYMLLIKGFNELKSHEITYEKESFYEPEKGDVNISAFFQKRVLLSDIHIGLMRHYEDKLATWIPDFEFESKRKNYGIKSNDRSLLAAVNPDGLLLLKGDKEDDFNITVLRFHYFQVERKLFLKRFREWERVWSNYDKLIMARDEDNLNVLKEWYQEEVTKYYKNKDSGLSVNDALSKYTFADYETLKTTGKFNFSKFSLISA